MKTTNVFFIFLVLCLVSFTCKDNKTPTAIFDFEYDLTPEQRSQLDSLYASHEKKTTNEIALVTTNDYSPDTSILFYSVNMARKLGVGKKEKDNGVLIVFSNQMRQTRIATGYGTEKVLTDEVAKAIIDSVMIPNFKKGKTFDGLWAGSLSIVEFLERPENKIPLKKRIVYSNLAGLPIK